MDKYAIVQRIENFASLDLAEKWDCSGWIVETKRPDIKRIMLALTVTNDVVKQALNCDCDMIISHHPVFAVPFVWKNIDIYCAHTNLDRANGGTTDTLVADLGLDVEETKDFLRFVSCKSTVADFVNKLKKISPNLRYVNNKKVKTLNKIAFCAGSGFEFADIARECGAEALVSGDLKFHPALESNIVLFDIGHFESEIGVLKVFAQLLCDIEVVYADECSPFLNCQMV